MSRNNKQVVNAKKPYCKVCHDAGKPESEYTSHWVKTLPDRNGKTTIVCPTLLSTECRFCYNFGHTAKFCPIIKENNKMKERQERQQKAEAEREQKKSQPVAQKKPASIFAVLAEDSSSDSEVDSKVSKKPVEKVSKKPVEVKVSKIAPAIVEDFPSLGSSVVKAVVKTGWADALAKPKEDVFMRQIEERSIMKQLPQSARKVNVIVPNVVVRDYSKQVYTKNWADWSDSEDEEEEEYQPTTSKPVVIEYYDDEDW